MGQTVRVVLCGGVLLGGAVVQAQLVSPSSSSAQVNPLGASAQVRPLAPPAPPQGLRAPASPVLIDRVVAIVNREVITASELARREKQFELNLRRQGAARSAEDRPGGHRPVSGDHQHPLAGLGRGGEGVERVAGQHEDGDQVQDLVGGA